MTTVDDAPAAAQVSVAESLSTVGYAMFALLQTGPLDNIPSMSEFIRTTNPPAVEPAVEPAADGSEATPFASEAYPGTPTPAADPVDAPVEAATPVSPAHEVDSAPAHGINPAVTGPIDLPPTATPVMDLPVPKDPVPPVQEYNGKETLAMLREISFLDE